jgi:hypothetical protein
MSTSKRYRRLVIPVCAIGGLMVYFAAYFASVSIQFQHSLVVKEQSIESPHARYTVGLLPERAAHWLFEPARLCDELYLRPHMWEDRQKTLVR